MKVLIIGSGGREHAIAWKLSKSPKVTKLYCAPGNAGIGQIAECVPISAMEFDKLADFAQENGIDLTVVGMDDPLVMFQALHFHPYNFPKEALVRSKVDEALSAQQESEAYSVQNPHRFDSQETFSISVNVPDKAFFVHLKVQL